MYTENLSLSKKPKEFHGVKYAVLLDITYILLWGKFYRAGCCNFLGSTIFSFKILCVCVHALTLSDHMDCSLPGSSVHGILQARILEWVAIPFSRGSSWPRNRTHVSYVSCISRWVLHHWATWEALMKVKNNKSKTSFLKYEICSF